MSTAVQFIDGTFRNQSVGNETFILDSDFEPYTTGTGGIYRVKNIDGRFPVKSKAVSIKVKSADSIKIVSTTEMKMQKLKSRVPVPANVMSFETAVADVAPIESDEEAMTRIRDRFEVLDDMTKAACAGDIRAMIVSGPPGVGKSFGVEQEIEQHTILDQLAGRKLRAEVVKGSATAIGLFSTLYKYSDANSVIVFDDCDSILLDDVCLNLLKGALDSGKKRTISWLADSNLLRREGIPDRFDFKGSVIFITNIKFDSLKSQKLKDHLDALQSRCHYLDLTIDTMRDKILRIKQIARDGELFRDYDFDQIAQDEIIEFMDVNQNRLREMSLRMALKIADLRKSFPMKWKVMAETTCMRPR